MVLAQLKKLQSGYVASGSGKPDSKVASKLINSCFNNSGEVLPQLMSETEVISVVTNANPSQLFPNIRTSSVATRQ